jgi:hypothetical protein
MKVECSSTNDCVVRSSYTTPKLTVYGDAKALTCNVSNTGCADNAFETDPLDLNGLSCGNS